MKLNETMSVIKAMDRPTLDDMAIAWIRQDEWQQPGIKWDITESVVNYYFEVCEEEFGSEQAHEMVQNVNWKDVVDLLIDVQLEWLEEVA